MNTRLDLPLLMMVADQAWQKPYSSSKLYTRACFG